MKPNKISFISMAGAIIGIVLLPIAWMMQNIVLFIGGTFLSLTGFYLYIFFHCYRREGVKLSFYKIITAVLAMLYIGLAVYTPIQLKSIPSSSTEDRYLPGIEGGDIER